MADDKEKIYQVVRKGRKGLETISPPQSYNSASFSRFLLWELLKQREALLIQRITDKKIIVEKKADFGTRF